MCLQKEVEDIIYKSISLLWGSSLVNNMAKRLQHSFVLGDILGRIYKFAAGTTVRSAILHDKRHSFSSRPENCRALKRNGQD